MPLFDPDTVLFNDRIDFGQWLAGHWYEHQQFIQIGLQQVKPIQFVSYDIFGWVDEPRAVKAWLEAHATMHDSLRQVTGVPGISLADVDFENPDSFNIWMNYHANEHDQLRTAFGVT